MNNDFEGLISAAAAQDFSGWDFTYLQDRWREEQPSWDYRQIVTGYLAQAASLLDMGTGGGEFLSSLRPLPARTSATEAYPPNAVIAQERLFPFGIPVFQITSDDDLPFQDRSFGLIINRHEAFSASEVARILTPGAAFITQQVGSENNFELNRSLQGADYAEPADWSLATAVEQLQNAGLSIIRQAEEFPETRFFDVGAVVYYLKTIPWQIPGFSAVDYRAPLKRIHDAIQAEGCFVVKSHRFLIVAQKPL